jgi:hypothetical protein
MKKYSGTIWEILEDSPDELVRLIREVYNKGLEDGMNASDSDDNYADYIFHNWEAVDEAMERQFTSVEEFIEEAFDENNYEKGY